MNSTCLRFCQTLTTQRGIGLPEVMMTLLLFSSGSLALTQLQLRNLQAAHLSHQTSRQALRQGEAIERLWLHRCYLATMDNAERTSYLLDTYPSVFSAEPNDPVSPGQIWQKHKPMAQDC